MVLFIKNSNNDVREIEVSENMLFTPILGEQYYFSGVSDYSFILKDNDTTLSISFIDYQGNKYDIELQGFIDLLEENISLNELDSKTILGVSTNENGDKLIDTTIHDSNLQNGEIIESLQKLLSMNGTALAKGIIIDNYQTIIDYLEATAASGEIQDTAYNLLEDDQENQNLEDEENRVDNPDNPESQNASIDRSSGGTYINHDPTLDITVKVTVDEDGTKSINFTTDDVDGDSVSVSGTAPNGIVSIENGQITYTPNENFNGDDTITLTVDDGNGGTITKTIDVSVDPVNDAPIIDVVGQTNVAEDGSKIINFTTDDIDGDSVVVNANATNGTVTVENGQITYTPNENFNGSDSISVTINDGNGGVVTQTIEVTVDPVNYAPTIDVQSTASVNENGTLTISSDDWSANDIEDGDLTPNFTANNGTVSLDNDGNIVYTPNENYNGSDTITVSVTDSEGATTTQSINVTVNAVPVAVDDIEHYTTQEIQIENSSFEQSSLKNGKYDKDVDSWNQTGKAGDWDPKDKHFDNNEVTGENVAYIQSGGTISQVLNETLQENSIYTLNINIGNRSDIIGGSSYSINLYAGDQIIGTVTQDDYALEDGKFTTAVLSVDTNNIQIDNLSGYGEALKIEIVNENSGSWKQGQISVDNVSMTRTGLHMYTTDEATPIIVDVLNNDSSVEGVLSITDIQGKSVTNNGSPVTIVDSLGDTIGIARVVDNKIEFTPGDKLKEMDIGQDQAISFQYGVSDGITKVNANVSIDVTGLGKEDNIDVQGNFNKKIVDTGLDDDSIEVSKSINKSNIDMGEGDDTLAVDKNISRSTIDMGEGDDNIEVAGSVGRSDIDMKEGDDTLIVNGNIGKGTDIDAGKGDDTISVGKSIKGTIDGGEGEDTLHLDMKTIRLDKLDSQIDNIEKIDLENGKNQKITLDQESVIKVTNNGNELELIGENGDVVSLKGDGWTKSTDTTDSQHYVNTNGASIYIDNDVQVEELF